jgi:hypothetical protein
MWGGERPRFKTDAIRGEEPGDWVTYRDPTHKLVDGGTITIVVVISKDVQTLGGKK